MAQFAEGHTLLCLLISWVHDRSPKVVTWTDIEAGEVVPVKVCVRCEGKLSPRPEARR